MSWQANLAGAMFGDENCATWDNTFRLFTWNMQYNVGSKSVTDKADYLTANRSLTIPNVYCLQEVYREWRITYSNPLNYFNNYYHVNVHKWYSTAVGSDVGFSNIYDVNYNDDCDDNDNGFDRRATVFQLQTNRCLIINVHLTFNEGAALACMFTNLAAIVNAHNGPVIVTGDFNEWNQSAVDASYPGAESGELGVFLDNTGLVDEGGYDPLISVDAGSRVDHILYKGCTLSNVTYTSPDAAYSDHGLLYADVTID